MSREAWTPSVASRVRVRGHFTTICYSAPAKSSAHPSARKSAPQRQPAAVSKAANAISDGIAMHTESYTPPDQLDHLPAQHDHTTSELWLLVRVANDQAVRTSAVWTNRELSQVQLAHAPASHAIQVLSARVCQYRAAVLPMPAWRAERHGVGFKEYTTSPTQACKERPHTRRQKISAHPWCVADGRISTSPKRRAMWLSGACAESATTKLGSQTKRLRRRRARQPCMRSTR
jgi:hypothetical protein